jgi:hypothetical protein
MHSFDPNIAQQVGVNAAVIYQNIRWWCEKNAANEKNLIDGHVWSYNSVRAFTTLFPYLTAKQVRTALETLENEGLILVANYNTDPRDRTKWYAVAGHENPSEQRPDAEAGLAPEGKSACPTGQSTFAPEGKPLPVNKPINKPVDKHTPPTPRDAGGVREGDAPQGELIAAPEHPCGGATGSQVARAKGGLRTGCVSLAEEFERVWEHYPRKVGKGAALKAWAKARRGATYPEITGPLGIWIKLQRGTPIEKTPHFTTWLNQERWNDDQTHARNRAETTTDRLNRLGAISTEDGSTQIAGPTRKPPQIELRMDP